MLHATTRLTAGQAAPDFHMSDTTGHEQTLQNYHGAPLLLSFYRSPDCPLCSLRLYQLRLTYPTLQQHGLRVLVIFEATSELVTRYAGSQHPPFPLIADPQRRLFARYAVNAHWSGLRGLLRLGAYWRAWRLQVGGRITTGRVDQLPADVLIGPDGIITHIYYGKDIGDHLPLPTLLTLIHPS